MKKLLFPFFFLFFCKNANAQVAISLDKQNVLYIGVDNPLTIAAFDTPDEGLDVSGKGVAITKNGNGHYTARVSSPGEAIIFVKNNKKQTTDSLQFRVKRIPDPHATLCGTHSETGGLISLGKFRILNGIEIEQRLDFDAICEIQGFEMTLSKQNGEILSAQVSGSRFDKTAKAIQAQVEVGDTVYFDNIKTRCPGDTSGRKINAMAWKIR